MTDIDFFVKDAFETLQAMPARSEAQVIAEAPQGINLLPTILLGIAALVWAMLWPAIYLDPEGVFTVNSVVGGVGMCVAVVSYAFHCPGAVIVPVGDLPVSAVRLAQAQRLATAFPETAPILDAWVSSGHPLRRRQMRALDEYVWARRAQLAAQELLAVPSPADDRAD
jgi:hypothetical protein